MANSRELQPEDVSFRACEWDFETQAPKTEIAVPNLIINKTDTGVLIALTTADDALVKLADIRLGQWSFAVDVASERPEVLVAEAISYKERYGDDYFLGTIFWRQKQGPFQVSRKVPGDRDRGVAMVKIGETVHYGQGIQTPHPNQYAVTADGTDLTFRVSKMLRETTYTTLVTVKDSIRFPS
jgi:hypothetical protein